jgi:hypothetical protein
MSIKSLQMVFPDYFGAVCILKFMSLEQTLYDFDADGLVGGTP